MVAKQQASVMHDASDHSSDDIVLVHSSDLHVDDDLGIGAYNGLIGLASVLATARSLAADIVLLAGDTFDNYRVSAPVLARATALLATAGVPVVLLPGNHDSIMPQCLLHRAGIIGLPDIHVLGVTNGHSVRAARTGNLGTRASRIRRHDAAAHAASANHAMADSHGAWPLCATRRMAKGSASRLENQRSGHRCHRGTLCGAWSLGSTRAGGRRSRAGVLFRIA